MHVHFLEPEEVDDALYKYAVIAARYRDQWIFCKNKTRAWELPGGHRETGESILDAARRELYEETGATQFEITPIYAYRIHNYGLLFYAEVLELGELPDSEIERIGFFPDLPAELSFPLYHPEHLNKVKEALRIGSVAM